MELLEHAEAEMGVEMPPPIARLWLLDNVKDALRDAFDHEYVRLAFMGHSAELARYLEAYEQGVLFEFF